MYFCMGKYHWRTGEGPFGGGRLGGTLSWRRAGSTDANAEPALLQTRTGRHGYECSTICMQENAGERARMKRQNGRHGCECRTLGMNGKAWDEKARMKPQNSGKGWKRKHMRGRSTQAGGGGGRGWSEGKPGFERALTRTGQH